MVSESTKSAVSRVGLSVLALSSRFDGRGDYGMVSGDLPAFSTRSVESF